MNNETTIRALNDARVHIQRALRELDRDIPYSEIDVARDQLIDAAHKILVSQLDLEVLPWDR